VSHRATIRWMSISSLCLLWGASAWGVPPSGRLPEGEAEANIRAVAPAPPTRSPLDSELIRRPGATGTTTPVPSAIKTPTLELQRVGLSLAAVIGLILALRWGGKKLFQRPGGARATRAVQLLARSPVSPRQQVLLLRVGRRILVVGDCNGQMNSLSEITDPEEVAALVVQLHEEKSDFSAKAFGALFSQASRNMGHNEEEAEESVPADEPPEPEASEPPLDPAISETREEITGLMEKIRVLSKHYRGGQA